MTDKKRIKVIYQQTKSDTLLYFACEFGFKACEKGWNLEQALLELKEMLREE